MATMIVTGLLHDRTIGTRTYQFDPKRGLVRFYRDFLVFYHITTEW